MANMIQKPVSFPPEDAKWLEREARNEVTSVADIVRRAVRDYRANRKGQK